MLHLHEQDTTVKASFRHGHASWDAGALGCLASRQFFLQLITFIEVLCLQAGRGADWAPHRRAGQDARLLLPRPAGLPRRPGHQVGGLQPKWGIFTDGRADYEQMGR